MSWWREVLWSGLEHHVLSCQTAQEGMSEVVQEGVMDAAPVPPLEED